MKKYGLIDPKVNRTPKPEINTDNLVPRTRDVTRKKTHDEIPRIDDELIEVEFIEDEEHHVKDHHVKHIEKEHFNHKLMRGREEVLKALKLTEQHGTVHEP